jgi:hypothetical protein
MEDKDITHFFDSFQNLGGTETLVWPLDRSINLEVFQRQFFTLAAHVQHDFGSVSFLNIRTFVVDEENYGLYIDYEKQQLNLLVKRSKERRREYW